MKNNVRQGLNFGVTRRGSLRSRAPCASLESFSVEKLKSCVCACVCVCVCVPVFVCDQKVGRCVELRPLGDRISELGSATTQDAFIFDARQN